MSMFDKYEDNSYTAYNLTPPSISRGVLTNFKTPLYTLDSYGNINRFYWVEGEEFVLNLKPIQKVKVPNGSIIYYQPGEKPTTCTVGSIGMKCYNAADYKSWTCVGFSHFEKDNYTWKQDPLFECLEHGGQEIELLPSMQGKCFKAQILNFRREVIYEFTMENDIVSIPINKEDTSLLVEGQFFIKLYTFSNDSTHYIATYGVTILGDLDRLSKVIYTDNYYVTRKEVKDYEEQPNWENIGSSDDPWANWTDVTSPSNPDDSNIMWEPISDFVTIDVGALDNKWIHI